MSINIRYPNITALSEKEQLAQVKSYLHQLVDQLNYALPTIGTEKQSAYEVQGGEMSYYEFRSLVVQELQKAEDLIDEIESDKANGEFDGKDGYTPIKGVDYFDGKDGKDGTDGMDGKDGKTPEKGVDYFTEEEVNSVATQAAGKILFTLDEDGNLYYEVEE